MTEPPLAVVTPVTLRVMYAPLTITAVTFPLDWMPMALLNTSVSWTAMLEPCAVEARFFHRLFGCWLVASAIVAIGNPAWAQQQGSGYLVLQDFSDCANGNVSANSPTIGGEVKVVRNQDGTSTVYVAVNGTENTTYHFFLKCVRILGDIKTSDEGVGYAQFSFRTTEIGNVIAFDMYPEGAPLGNKYQSTQINIQ